jgi:V-type H+-transporting ATPase subunit a
MELFRSERMSLARVIVPEEAARDTIERLGELACAQFQDLNPSVPLFKRAYAAHVGRAEELLRRLRYFEEEARRAEMPVARARTRGGGTDGTTDDERRRVGSRDGGAGERFGASVEEL